MEKEQEAFKLLAELLLGNMRNEISQEIRDAIAQIKQDDHVNVHVQLFRADELVGEIKEHTHPKFHELLEALADGNNVMLVGPAGTGKSYMAEQAAKALGVEFGSISCSEGMTENGLCGSIFPMANGEFRYLPSVFVDTYEQGGFFCLDEIDASNPNVLTFLNQSLAGRGFHLNQRRINGDNPWIKRHENFMAVACANTFGFGAGSMYVGRNQLDAATLDRFEVIEIDYDTSYEAKLAPGLICDWVWNLRRRVQEARIKRVVSTRMVQRMAKKAARGVSFDKIKQSALVGWTPDQLVAVGERL